MNDLLLWVIIALVLLGALLYIVYLGFHPKEENKSKINKVFEHMNTQYKPLEKANAIQELFVDCAQFCNDNLFESKNPVKSTIFTGELALHIFSLWASNYLLKFKTKSEKDEIINGINFQAFIIAIKKYLNLLVVNIGQDELDQKIIMSIIFSRVTQIYKEKDIETRNLNFLNICNLAIQYEEKTVFMCGNFDDMPLALGNSLDMIFLPLVYSSGLVDKYLEKLDNAL